MRRFVRSVWFPIVVGLVLAGVSTLSLSQLVPESASIGNDSIFAWGKTAGWATGPVFGLLTILLAGILNLLRRAAGLRKTDVLHPVVALLAVLPWLAFAWSLTDEPRYTAFARAAIDFVGRPLLWGCLAASLVAILGFAALLTRPSPARS